MLAVRAAAGFSAAKFKGGMDLNLSPQKRFQIWLFEPVRVARELAANSMLRTFFTSNPAAVLKEGETATGEAKSWLLCVLGHCYPGIIRSCGTILTGF